MYLEEVVLPKFNVWVNGLDVPVGMEDAKRYARYFIINTIDPTKVGSRGAVYDIFEDVSKYAKMKKVMYKGQLSPLELQQIDNLCVLSLGVVWAMEHDAFDTIKYDVISKWGMDITEGKEHMA